MPDDKPIQLPPANGGSNPPPTPPAPAKQEPTFSFNKEKLVAHMKDVEEFLLKFAGKKAHNPFKVITEINKFRNRIEKGEATKELSDAILALKKEAPVIPHLVEAHAQEQVQMEARKNIQVTLPPRQG